MNRPTYEDLANLVQGFNHRLAMLEITGFAYGERLDLLEMAWEKLVDKIGGHEEALQQIRGKLREDMAGINENLITLRDDILGLHGTRPPGYEEIEQEMLDEIPEFDTVAAVEKYAKEELAKGNRATTIQKWIDEARSDKEDSDEWS